MFWHYNNSNSCNGKTALLLTTLIVSLVQVSAFNTLLPVPVKIPVGAHRQQQQQLQLQQQRSTFDRKTVVVNTEPSSKDNTGTDIVGNNDDASTGIVGKVDNAQFGEVVSMKKKPNNDAQFGEVVSIRPQAKSSTSTDDTMMFSSTSEDTTKVEAADVVEVDAAELTKSMRRRNTIAAITSVVVAISSYVYQLLNPVTELQLLVAMEQSSKPINVIGANNKPTVIDFWAPWCDNCKLSAATMSYIENKYGDNEVNFISVNADTPEAYDLISAFGVDAIPHVAMIDATGYVETALIGPIPKRVFEADINTMIQNAKDCNNGGAKQDDVKAVVSTEKICKNKQELPYTMYDAFEFRPDQRIVKFD